MNENTLGITPNNDGELKPELPAEVQNNNGSEPTEIKPAADENQNPEKDKKGRPTIAERLAKAKERKQKAEEDERKLMKDYAAAEKLQTKKFKSVVGGACLRLLKVMRNHQEATKLAAQLRLLVDKKDQRWADAHFDNFAIQLLEDRNNKNGANGESPSEN